MGENFYRHFNSDALTVDYATAGTTVTGTAQKTNGLHYLLYVTKNETALTGTANGTVDVYGSVDGNTWTDLSVQVAHNTLVIDKGVQSAAVDIKGYQFYRFLLTKGSVTAGTIKVKAYASR